MLHFVPVIVTSWGGEGSPLPDGLIFEGVSTKPIKVSVVIFYAILKLKTLSVEMGNESQIGPWPSKSKWWGHFIHWYWCLMALPICLDNPQFHVKLGILFSLSCDYTSHN